MMEVEKNVFVKTVDLNLQSKFSDLRIVFVVVTNCNRK